MVRPNQAAGEMPLFYFQMTRLNKYWNYNNQIDWKPEWQHALKLFLLFCSLFNTCLMHSRELLLQDLRVKQSVTVSSRWSDPSTQDQRVSGNSTIKIKEISTFRHFKGFWAVRYLSFQTSFRLLKWLSLLYKKYSSSWMFDAFIAAINH